MGSAALEPEPPGGRSGDRFLASPRYLGQRQRSRLGFGYLAPENRATIIWKTLEGSHAAALRIEPHRVKKGRERPAAPGTFFPQ